MWGGAVWLSGLVATLALLPEHRFAECASCPEGCLAQPSNLGLDVYTVKAGRFLHRTRPAGQEHGNCEQVRKLGRHNSGKCHFA
jgi:hypothetical protein